MSTRATRPCWNGPSRADPPAPLPLLARPETLGRGRRGLTHPGRKVVSWSRVQDGCPHWSRPGRPGDPREISIRRDAQDIPIRRHAQGIPIRRRARDIPIRRGAWEISMAGAHEDLDPRALPGIPSHEEVL
jgi:hypothetical protein